MKQRLVAIVFALMTFVPALVPTLAQADAILPVHVGGRVATTPEGFIHQWPGVYFESRFHGTALTLRFDDAANKYNLYVDSRLHAVIDRPGTADYTVEGLEPGTHLVRLEKRTESQDATGVFKGFYVKSGNNVMPAPSPRARQIEFIGDSDMVAYASTSTKRDCSEAEIWETTDTSVGYPPRIAKAFNADYQINAYSGMGVVRNWDGGKPHIDLTTLYARTLFADPAPNDPKDWQPQVIVVAIGGNDFSTEIKAGEKWPDRLALIADWQTTFTDFLTAVRARNPNALILLGLYTSATPDQANATRAVFEARRTAGDVNLTLITYPESQNTACNYHHSLDDYAALSALITATLDARPGIWQGR